MSLPITLRIPQQRQHGLSLIELMVSLAIGLVLLMGITSLIVQQSSTRDELEKSSRQIENGRYAMQILHTDLEQAGFYGLFYQPPPYGSPLPPFIPLPPGFPASPALPDPCATSGAALYGEMPLYIQGYDSSSNSGGIPNNALPTANFSCALDGVNAGNNAVNYQVGTDILVIRRADTNVPGTAPDTNPVLFGAYVSGVPSTTTVPLTAGQVYLQTVGNSAVMGIGAGAAGDTNTYPLYLSTRSYGTLIYASLRRWLTHIYFVSPCSMPAGGGTSCTGIADDNGHPIPTLKMLELSYDPTTGLTVFKLTSLVEGVENMQLEYGVDGDNTVSPASAVDGYPDSYCTNPDNCQTPNNLPTLNPTTNPTNWQNVMAVRVNVLSRNTQCTTGYVDTKSYQLGSLAPPKTAASMLPVPYYAAPAAVACNNGDYKRHVFSEVVRLINPSSRRAAQ